VYFLLGLRERNSESLLSIDISVYTNSRSFKYANTTILAKGPAYFRRVSFELPLNFVPYLELFSSIRPSVHLWRVSGGYVYFV